MFMRIYVSTFFFIPRRPRCEKTFSASLTRLADSKIGVALILVSLLEIENFKNKETKRIQFSLKFIH